MKQIRNITCPCQQQRIFITNCFIWSNFQRFQMRENVSIAFTDDDALYILGSFPNGRGSRVSSRVSRVLKRLHYRNITNNRIYTLKNLSECLKLVWNLEAELKAFKSGNTKGGSGPSYGERRKRVTNKRSHVLLSWAKRCQS